MSSRSTSRRVLYGANATSAASPLTGIAMCVGLVGMSRGTPETIDREGGDERGHFLGRPRTVGTEPLCRPVERAEERAGRNGRVAAGERAPGDAVGNQGANPAFVAIALGDDDRAAFG